MGFDSKIWGPHFWFFLHTISYTYPENTNEVIKRKYYDLLMNFPLFIPDENIGKEFALLLDKYPFVPYLDKRESFIRWVNFIHNKINIMLKKPEIPLLVSLDKYLLYIKNTTKIDEKTEKIYYMDLIVYTILIILMCCLIYYLVNKM
jgi:hypothetical protein